MKKLISIIITMSLLWQGVAWAVPLNSPQSIVHSPQILDNIYIPEQYGSIDKSTVNSPQSTEKNNTVDYGLSTMDSPTRLTVVLVKDAHCHYEAQENIEKILDILTWDYKVDWVGLFFYLSKNSSELSKKSRWMLNCLRIFRPSNPDAGDWGGRSWHTTSIFLNPKVNIFSLDTVTTGAYSIPLAVINSIFLLDFMGLHPMAIAVSIGIVVIVAPVSIIISIIREPLGPERTTLQKMILSLGLSLYLDILKCSSVSLWESVFSIFNHQKAFSLDRFSINLISIRAVRQKTPGNRGVGGFFNFIYFNQKPLRMFTESFMDIFDFFSFHFINISNVNITFTLKKVNIKKVLRKVRFFWTYR